MISSARATASSGPPQPGHRSRACRSASPSRQTRARHAAHLKCAIVSVVPGRAQAGVGGAGGALEFAEAVQAGRLRVVDASAVEGQSLAVIARFGVEPGVGWVTGWHGGPSL